MSFLVWDAGIGVGMAARRRVLSAEELPHFDEARALVGELTDRLRRTQETQAQVLADARQAGHAQGLAEGRAEASAACAQRLLALEASAHAQTQQREQDVARLAIAVVHKLLGDWPEPARLAAAAAHAAASLSPARVLRVRVHPDHLAAAREQSTHSNATWLQQAEWLADPTLASDACRIETAHGAVDVGPAEQLARLAAAWNVSQP